MHFQCNNGLQNIFIKEYMVIMTPGLRNRDLLLGGHATPNYRDPGIRIPGDPGSLVKKTCAGAVFLAFYLCYAS